MPLVIPAHQAEVVLAKTIVRLQCEADLVRGQYTKDPIGWMIEQMGVSRNSLVWSENPGYEGHEWDGTPEPLVQIAEAIAESKDVGVEGATATSKTYLAALLVLWFLDCFENAEVVTSAPKEKQLKLHMWAEIGKLWPRFQRLRPQARLLTLQVRMLQGKDYWTAVAFPVGVGASEESASKAQGFHAEHMLIITEETPGINPAVMRAFNLTCSAPHNLHLALGNPDHTGDELHKFCLRQSTTHVRISAYDYPNVVTRNPSLVPGAVSQKAIGNRRDELGEDSPLYLSRVRGQCPAQGKDSLIRMEWIRPAVEREDPDHPDHKKLLEGSPAIGVDVANSPKGDLGVIAIGKGAVLQELIARQCPDSNELGREVQILALQQDVKPEYVGVDSVGVGAGTVNELKRLGWIVQSLGGANREVRMEGEEHFYNLRSQMWWQLRKDLQSGEVALLEDEKLHGDLVAPRWSLRNGKITVESKEDLVKRLGRSPDRGDAVVYWNWVRQYRGTASIGGAMVDL